MIQLLYSEVNILCIIILLLIWKKVRLSVDTRSRKKQFARVLISSIAFLLSDLIWINIDNNFLIVGGTINWLVNGAYFLLTGAMGFCWFIYSENVQNSPLVKSHNRRVLCTIPLLISFILILLNFKWGFLFYIDENNIYRRGSLFIIQILIAYGYIAFSAGKAFVGALRTTDYARRKELFTLSSLVVPPVILGFLQIIIVGLPVFCIGITLALLSVYMEFQEQLISLDPLTQINNRNQLKRYLSEKMEHAKEDTPLYLLIMDVDYFKRINDQYGHIEGDNALLCVTEAIKQCCAGQNYFLSRFGGDEFIIVGEFEPESEVVKLCQSICDCVATAHEKTGSMYQLSLSIGYTRYQKEFKTIQDFIGHADAELYKVKRAKR